MKTVEQVQFQLELNHLLENTDKPVYSVQIQAEEGNGYELNIWDERENARCEDIEGISGFQSMDEAIQRLQEITVEHNGVAFLQIKAN